MSANAGLMTAASRFDPAETTRRLKDAIAVRGMILFAEIDHAAGAAAIGAVLRPTTLLIFGNAKGGTPLMQADQIVGLDLPLKVLIWTVAEGTTKVTANDPAWIAVRHGLDDQSAATIEAMTNLMNALWKAAT